MKDAGIPSFPDVAGYLFCIIVCISVIIFAVGCIAQRGVQNVPVSIWLPFFGLVVVMVIAVAWLVRQLFPERFRIGHTATVLKEVIEIEGRV